MPIFRKKAQKKTRESRLVEDVEDFKIITLRVSDTKVLKFVSGSWVALKKNQTSESVDDGSDVSSLIKDNRKLEDENRMLTAKIDILLDLLTETVAEK